MYPKRLILDDARVHGIGVLGLDVNLSGAEFGNPDGVAGTDYLYPSEATIAYFAGKTWATWRIDTYLRKIAFCRKEFPAPVNMALKLRDRIRGGSASGGLAA